MPWWWKKSKSEPKAEVYVPKRWGSMECIKELRSVWFVNPDLMKDNKGELLDVDSLTKLIAILWAAERDGMTYDEIDAKLKDRTLEDVIENGL